VAQPQEPIEAIRQAADERKAHAVALLARLDYAFVVAVEDVAGGPARLAELADEVIEAAVALVEAEIPQAVTDAERLIVDPVLRSQRGRVRLRDGWKDRVGARTEFYGEQVTQRVAEARARWLAELGRLSEEADAHGWDEETLRDILSDEVRVPGPDYAAFRRSIRDAVAALVGQAWTETWTAAWRELEADPDLLDRARAAGDGEG
jgi:hypothetical protein